METSIKITPSFEQLCTEDVQLRCFKFALSLCHHHQNAEDMAAEAILRGYERFNDKYVHESAYKFQAWLNQIVLYQFMNEWRLNKKVLQKYGPQLSLSVDKPPLLGKSEHIEDGLTDELAMAVRELSGPEAELVDGIVFGDLTYEEAAVEYEIPAGTVMSRFHRAKQKMRRSLSA